MSDRAAARSLLGRSLAWDNHACMPLRPEDQAFLPQLERAKAAGVDVVTLNIGMDLTAREEHLAVLANFTRWIDAHDNEYVVARSCADILAAKAAGKLAIVFDVEGMALLDDGDLALISQLRKQGAIWMLVAYNRNNRAGGGCLDKDPGLSGHGRLVLAEMKRVGLLACCSHTGHRTALDVISQADNPVIFSHSNPSAVYAHVRNIPDQLIKACANGGGVVGVNGVGDFLGPGSDYAGMMVRHIDHIVQLVGPEHVGISLDYVFDVQEVIDFIDKLRESFGSEMADEFSYRFAPPETFVDIVVGLLALGYADSDIEGIVGGNWMRVAGQVWG